MYQIKVFTWNPFSENSYVLYEPQGDCWIIDPGCYDSLEQNELLHFITEQGLTPTMLLNTHGHIDHILGNDFVMRTWNLPLHIHEGELFTYKEANKWTAMFGMKEIQVPENCRFIQAGDRFSLGDAQFEVLFAPGHSVAHCCFSDAANQLLISGDVLFRESIGRTDLPGGNHEQLLHSIRTQLWPLDDFTRVFPGHGPATTIGHEKQYNPFLT